MEDSKWTFRKVMVFIVLASAVAIAYQIPYLRYTFYDQMVACYGLTNTQMSLIGTAVTIVNIICYPIGGIVADKFSARNLIIFTLGALAALTIWFAFTTNFIMLMIIHLLYGFVGIATLWSAYLKAIRNLGNEKNQSKIFGFNEATRGIIQTVFGFVFLGIVGACATYRAGLEYMLLAGAGITLVFFVLAIIFMPKDEVVTPVNGNGEPEKVGLIDAIKLPGVWVCILIIAGAYTVYAVGNGYLTTYTTQVLGISSATASAVGIVRTYIIVFLGGFFGGWLLDKFTYKGKGLFIIFALIIVSILLMFMTNKIIPICIAMTLFIGFFANILKCTYWSTLDQAGIPIRMTGAATGIISFIGFLPELFITMLCGIILDKATAAGNVNSGFVEIFSILVVFSIIGIIGCLLLVKSAKKQEALKAVANKETAK